MINSGTFRKLRPLSLLRHLSSCSDTTCLQVVSNSVSWLIYLEQGKITYATHSIEPFDRLERHLRRLSHQIPALKSEIRLQLRLMFEPDSQNQLIEHQSNSTNQPSEYQAICWLVNQQYLHSNQAAVVIQELVKEVIESFLLIKEGRFELTNTDEKVSKICRLDLEKVVERCQDKLSNWHSLGPAISSPHQRPYICIQTQTQQIELPGLQQNLTDWMKGFSLRHLAVMINQDELKLAQNLHPYILNGAILLHQPDPPFDKLPKTFIQSIDSELSDITTPNTTPDNHPDIPGENTGISEQLSQIDSPLREKFQQRTTNNTPTATATARKLYKIVSVDDSPTILKEISRFLEEESFVVVTINDPLKAVMSVIRHKPDLILLDLNMEGIDGYELCRLIRNNSLFKNTPIIMVTSNKGLINKVRARFVGASGYLTKPFTRSDLLKIVFMHLT